MLKTNKNEKNYMMKRYVFVDEAALCTCLCESEKKTEEKQNELKMVKY